MVYVPCVPVTVLPLIDVDIVWCKNKWNNLLLKIKFFFVKPRYLKHVKGYANKPINHKFYKKIEITKSKNE